MKFVGFVIVVISFLFAKRAVADAQQRRVNAVDASFMLVALACTIGFSVGGVLMAYHYVPPSGPFVNPHLKVEAFVWPNGCLESKKGYAKKYGDTERIPRACFPDNNLFPDWRKYGFPSSGGKRADPYYRLGNDAVAVSCPDSIFTTETECVIDRAVFDVFHQ